MRITLLAKTERADGTEDTVEFFRLDRAPNAAPSAGLGMVLAESRDVSAALQRVVLREQVQEVLTTISRCPSCSAPLSTKDCKTIMYRTAFGKVSCPSPRLYSRCSSCGSRAHGQATFSPLAIALPERTHPQWTWLQTRFASVMSYRWARTLLAHSFTGAAELPSSSIRQNVLRIGARIESEVQRRINNRLQEMPLVDDGPLPDVSRARHALQVDAGYVRSVPREGTGWISVIASKVVRPESTRTHAHAYSIGYEPMQGMRQEAFLSSVGIGYDVPVTVLSDGGEDVGSAASLGVRCERILDWFHIGMRFQHLLRERPAIPPAS